MRILKLPVADNETQISATYSLDGIGYQLALTWDERAQGWYLDVILANPREVLIEGVRVVCGYPLLRWCRNANAPRGLLFALSLDRDNDRDPGVGDLGTGRRVQLLYYDESELVLTGSSTVAYVEALP